jgi:NADH dehydrogenase
VVFGKDDDFINRFASIMRLYIGLFPLACANSKLAPVYVGDLVEKMVACIDDTSSFGRRFSACGPEIFTLQQIVELIISTLHLPVRIVPLGNGLSRLQAMVLQNLPGKLFTMDNYRSLQTDSVCKDGDLCETSLRQYMRGLPAMFGNKRHYDRFRKGHAQDNVPENPS